MVDVPVDAVVGEACEDVHHQAAVVAAENAGVLALKRDNCGIEDAVGCGDQIAGNDRIVVIAPYGLVKTLRLVLPGHIRERLADDFCHDGSSLSFKIIRAGCTETFLCNRFHIYQYYNTNSRKSKGKFFAASPPPNARAPGKAPAGRAGRAHAQSIKIRQQNAYCARRTKPL